MKRLKKYENFRESLNEGLFDSKSPLVEDLLNIRMELKNDHDFTLYEKSYLKNYLKPILKEIIGRSVNYQSELYDKALDHVIKRAEKNGRSFVITLSPRDNDLKIYEYSDNEYGFRKAKEYLIPQLEGILELAENDEKYRLCSKIKKYIDLLNQL